MTTDLQLRRYLYEEAARCRGRRRRMLRRQLKVLDLGTPGWPDGGAAGVREPRRPRPPAGPITAARQLRPR